MEGGVRATTNPAQGRNENRGVRVMTTKKPAAVLAAAALLGMSYGAQAHVISLDPIIQKVSLGDTVEVDVDMFFSEATLGGAFDLFYNSTQLEFVSFAFDDFFYN